MPATEPIDFEREFEELVRDLRSLPTAATEHLRARVRALGEPARPQTLWDRLLTVPWRRSLLVLAPVCVLGLVSAAVIHGVLNSGPRREALVKASPYSTARPSVQRGQAPQGAGVQHGAAGGTAAQDKGAFGAATASPFASPLPTPNPNRYQDYQAWMTVRVKDVGALSDRTNEAMQAAREFGGYVVSLEQSTTAGQPGQADLVLRVPVARVQDALVRLSGLGTVIERHLSIQDLEQVVQQQRARILQLKLFIARAAEQLKGSLPADVRLRLQLQLDEARGSLARVTSANKGTIREATLSRISLTLTTQRAVGLTKKGGMGRAERAAREAASFLAAVGAVLLFLLIVLSPLVVLAVASIWAARAYRRREERQLLAE